MLFIRTEVLFKFRFDRSVMTSSKKKKPVPENEPIEINKTQPKKQYRPPHFEVLTPEQAKARLTERGLPGDAATEKLLKAASKSGPTTKDS